MQVSELPKDISLDRGRKKQFWDKLIKSGPFKNKEYWEIFLYALALGYERRKDLDLKSKVGTIPSRTIKDKKELWSLMKAIAISEESINIIMDEKKIAEISEKYANAGIKILYEKIMGSGTTDPVKILESEAIKKIK